MRCILTVILLFLCLFVNAQQNRIKGGGLGIFGIVNIGIGTFGYERLNKMQTASWQLHASFAGDAVAADARANKRSWITLDKTYYIKNKVEKRHFFYSPFAEMGNRITTPGHEHSPSDSIFNRKKSFEINPGIVIGGHFKVAKIFGFEFYGGPKVIFADTRTKYHNSLIRKDYFVKSSTVKAGFRCMIAWSWEF